MSNFKCSECGMINIDCGKEGYKTPKELRYEKALEEIEEIVSKDYYNDSWADISIKLDKILNIINKAKNKE